MCMSQCHRDHGISGVAVTAAAGTGPGRYTGWVYRVGNTEGYTDQPALLGERYLTAKRARKALQGPGVVVR